MYVIISQILRYLHILFRYTFTKEGRRGVSKGVLVATLPQLQAFTELTVNAYVNITSLIITMYHCTWCRYTIQTYSLHIENAAIIVDLKNVNVTIILNCYHDVCILYT